METEVLGRILFISLADEWTVIKGRRSFHLFQLLLSNSALYLVCICFVKLAQSESPHVEHLVFQLQRTVEKKVRSALCTAVQFLLLRERTWILTGRISSTLRCALVSVQGICCLNPYAVFFPYNCGFEVSPLCPSAFLFCVEEKQWLFKFSKFHP